MEVRVLGGALWRQRLLVLLVLLVTGGAVAVGLQVAPRSYSATASLTATLAPQEAGAGEDLGVLRGTLAQLANSRVVVDDVLARLAVDRTVEDLRRSIYAEHVEGTTVVKVTVRDPSPLVAAQVANLVADVLPLHDPSDGRLLYTLEDPAVAPETFSSPDIASSAGAGAVLACILAACAALVRDHRVRTVADAAAVEEAALAPLLAHLPAPRDPTMLPALYPGTTAAEAFRRLGVAVEADRGRASAARLVVAGIGGGDVDVWLGANLAVALARQDREVLLVDARLGEGAAQPTRPSQAAVAAQATPAPPPARLDEPPSGLYDVLLGADLDEALTGGPVDHLTVLPAGRWGGEPVSPLVESRFVGALRPAQDRFDLLVVLAPPLDVSDDARVMAAGGLLVLVVEEGAVSASALRSHADRVRAVGAHLVGAVLLGPHAERSVGG